MTARVRPSSAALSGALLLLLAAGCAGLRGVAEDPAATASRQAEELVNASMKRDVARTIDLSYPGAVEALGGRERAIAAAQARMKEIDDAGATVRSMTVGPASQVVTERGTMYAVLPTTVAWTYQGRNMSGSSYLLGVSTDGGKTWTFADGTALIHPETRRRIFPSLPSTLTLPLPRIQGLAAPQ